jgi:hypothetical protein
MPAKTPCPRCNRVGFVRFEHVIRAGTAQLHYYCGSCEHSWAVDEDGTEHENYGRPPERSRSDGR